jgi:hypothetical protein
VYYPKNTIKICNCTQKKNAPCVVKQKNLYLQQTAQIAYMLVWNKYRYVEEGATRGMTAILY